jgi:hypothetical protein
MVLDLNTILQYAGKDGGLNRDRQRRLFSVIDGVIGGERQGPLAPTRKEAGVLIAGDDVVLTDSVATMVMGFEPHELKLMHEAFRRKEYRLSDYDSYEDSEISSNDPLYESVRSIKEHHLGFEAPIGWERMKLPSCDKDSESNLSTRN